MSASQPSALIAQLRQLATTAASSGTVTEAPSAHPDAKLLELCAEVIDLHAQEAAIFREARKLPTPSMTNPAFAAEIKKRDAVAAWRRSPMMRIPKIPAATAAGVYAKAHVLKLSHGTAPRLAVSVAEDLVNCPGLRSSLWPADMPTTEAGD